MVKLYSTHCPKCNVVEVKLKQKNIEYVTIDDIDTVRSTGEAQKILSAPFIECDGIFYNFSDTIKLLNGVK